MATDTRVLPQELATAALWRQWAQGIHDGLIAAGLVQTADTGQVDIATVGVPSSATTKIGARIYRFTDALQATAPVFIKVTFGTGNAFNRPGLWLQVATGTNGASGLTGQVGTEFFLQAVATSAAETRTQYVAGNGSWVTFANGVDVGPAVPVTAMQKVHMWSIERSKDATGADTSEGIIINATCNSLAQSLFLPFFGAIPTAETSWPSLTSQSNDQVSGADVGVCPVFPFRGRLKEPGIGVLSYINANIAPLTPILVSMYGVAHTYLPLSSNVGGVAVSRGALSTIAAAMMRWE